jgi:hypothetical protein
MWLLHKTFPSKKLQNRILATNVDGEKSNAMAGRLAKGVSLLASGTLRYAIISRRAERPVFAFWSMF